LWEKELRRFKKEFWKSNSNLVKVQEELKASRNSQRLLERDIEEEKERSSKREQEAFAARYQLVGLQEELTTALEKVKLVEQERDALRTIAKNEEIARIAAEGRIPLPQPKTDDEFASPRKVSAPLPEVTIKSSAASEEEIENLREELKWERKRADRAYELVEYVEVECQFRCCSCRRTEKGVVVEQSPSKAIVNQKFAETTAQEQALEEDQATPVPQKHHEPLIDIAEPAKSPAKSPSKLIFIPSANIFPTENTTTNITSESPWISPAKPSTTHKTAPVAEELIQFADEPAASEEPQQPQGFSQARTPSVEPPASIVQQAEEDKTETSLLSLIDGSTNQTPESSEGRPSVIDNEDNCTVIHRSFERETTIEIQSTLSREEDVNAPVAAPESPSSPASTFPQQSYPTNIDFHNPFPIRTAPVASASHIVTIPSQTTTSTTTKFTTFLERSTTTRIPLADPDADTPHSASFPQNATLPASAFISITPLSTSYDSISPPTMTREEALAAIRERRGRARSMAELGLKSGMMTPKKVSASASAAEREEVRPERRDLSAPATAVRGASGQRRF
jgi:hypothetical protein